MLRLKQLVSLVLLFGTYAQPPPFQNEDMVITRNQPRSLNEPVSKFQNPPGNATQKRWTWMDFLLQGSDNTDSRNNRKNPSLSLQSSAISSEHYVDLLDKPDIHRFLSTSTHFSSQQSSPQSYNSKQKVPSFGESPVTDAKDITGQYVTMPSSGSKIQQTPSATNTVARDREQKLVIASTDASAIDSSPFASVGDDAKAAISALLRDTFLSQNPSIADSQVDTGLSQTQAALSLSHPHPGRSEDSSLHSLGGNELHHSDNALKDRMKRMQSSNLEENDEEPINVEQRSWRCPLPDVLVGEEDLPWTCQQRFAWRHLGEHVYPSRLYEAVCEGRSCWYGHFNCTSITYTVHVLQVCRPRGCQDQRVPSLLRSRYQWMDLNVTVGCQCVR